MSVERKVRWMKRIGLLGGTFDPPHIGHFIIADEVRASLQLDEIWFIPNNEPPHKSKALSDKLHRLQMLNQVIGGNDIFSVNDIELHREGKSYTIDTVTELTNEYPNMQFFFIIGADMVEYLPHWKDIDKLMEKIQFVGVKRQGYELKSSYPIIEVGIPTVEISSSDIRERVEQGLPFQFLVPKEVYLYIKEHRLYGFGRSS